MEEALFFESIATSWGWPPSVALEQPHELLERMLEVSGIRNEVAERKSREG